ncbi:MAG: hypothetical protein Q7U57_09665 [Methylovulum sp.]|nr:hypothetical protein [Methylovulum sp.]
MSDIIGSVIEICRQQLNIQPDVAQRLEASIRGQLAGEFYYIGKRGLVTKQRCHIIQQELKAGHSVAYIEEKHDIPRSTIYRLINHNRGQPWQD